MVADKVYRVLYRVNGRVMSETVFADSAESAREIFLFSNPGGVEIVSVDIRHLESRDNQRRRRKQS